MIRANDSRTSDSTAVLIYARRASEVRERNWSTHYNTERIFAHRSALEHHHVHEFDGERQINRFHIILLL